MGPGGSGRVQVLVGGQSTLQGLEHGVGVLIRHNVDCIWIHRLTQTGLVLSVWGSGLNRTVFWVTFDLWPRVLSEGPVVVLMGVHLQASGSEPVLFQPQSQGVRVVVRCRLKSVLDLGARSRSGHSVVPAGAHAREERT